MNLRTILAVSCVCVLSAAACGGSKADAPAASGQAATTPAVAPASNASSAGDFGVAACDEYMNKYTACITGKVPEAARAQFLQALEQSKVSWKAAAATPQGREGLTAACTQALATSKVAMQMYGCDW